jgi:hypothetical protein
MIGQGGQMQDANMHTLQVQPNALLAGAILDEYSDLLNGHQTRQSAPEAKTSSENCKDHGKTSSQSCSQGRSAVRELSTVLSWTELPRA